MTLAEAAPQLYTEVIDNLERRNISPATCVLNDDEVTVLIERLKTAVIREACGCGQADKRDYHTVRLNVRGDLMVDIDAECDVFKVERLYDLRGAESTRYVRNADGEWERVSLG